MNLSISARITLGFSIALLVLLLIAAVVSRNLASLAEDTTSVEHTLEVLHTTQRVAAGIAEIQSISRGYALARDPSAGAGFAAANASLAQSLRSLRELTQDNPLQQQRLQALALLVEDRVDMARELMQASDQASLPAEELAQLVTDGRDQSRRIDEALIDTEDEERRLLQVRKEQSAAAQTLTRSTLQYGTLGAAVLLAVLTWYLTQSIREPLARLIHSSDRLSRGNYAERVPVQRLDEVGRLATAFNAMAAQIEERQKENDDDRWQRTGLARFSRLFEAERQLAQLGRRLLEELASLLDIQHAVLYLPGSDGNLERVAEYAASSAPRRIAPGEGLIGQALRDHRRLVLDEVPEDYVRITSALGEARPRSVAILPALLATELKAVLELASLKPFTALQLDFLEKLAESLSLVVTTIQASDRTTQLLRDAQALSMQLQQRSDELHQSERLLQQQQEELRQTNEELEQTNQELQQANVQMEERSALLAEQKLELERSARDTEEARRALERQSARLEQISQYKSQFLANMSHELRTPLNSLLILSKVLADNQAGNLTAKQVHHATTIHSAGQDLLTLINEILDLSKIEAGAMDLDIAPVDLAALCTDMENTFAPVAEDKQLQLRVHREDGLAASITTDPQRLRQILKNLLSNALKFTHRGSVELIVRRADCGGRSVAGLESLIAFEVRDTGIGIAADRLEQIFEAFHQGDAGTARKYGGTGLGLTISRELAQRLGGSLEVASEVGRGTTFTLYLPHEATAEQLASVAPAPAPALSGSIASPGLAVSRAPELPDLEPAGVNDDRESIQPADLSLLVIEDDPSFSQVMAEFARERGFKVVLARTGGGGLALARRLRPSAITLDLRLPDADGRMVLDLLKHDATTRHIPVHVISVDEARERMLLAGAVSFLQKPVTKEAIDAALQRTIDFVQRPMKSLLIVEDDAVQRQALVELIADHDVSAVAVTTATEALAQLGAATFDCIVVDLVLPDIGGIALIRMIHERLGQQAPPIIVYTAKELSRQEETELRRLSEAIILKGARSPERLLDETALFLHRVQATLPEPKRRILEQVQRDDPVLSGRKVLIIDDDVRNIFAITVALESYRMEVIYAESGSAGLDLLTSTPGIDAVLMDVMMPEMDGFETTRRIRGDERFSRLPIIMVTAKAMKGDRERCLAAGASDYITKPVDMDQLRSLLRVWLYR